LTTVGYHLSILKVFADLSRLAVNTLTKQLKNTGFLRAGGWGFGAFAAVIHGQGEERIR